MRLHDLAGQAVVSTVLSPSDSTTIASEGTSRLIRYGTADAAFGEDRVAAGAARGHDPRGHLLLVQIEGVVETGASARAKGVRDTRPRPGPG